MKRISVCMLALIMIVTLTCSAGADTAICERILCFCVRRLQ